jgi:serine protease Do
MEDEQKTGAPALDTTSVAVPTPVKKQNDGARRTQILAVVALMFISTAMGFLGGWIGAEGRISNGGLSQSAEQKIVSTEGDLISSIAKDVGPSVVSIDVSETVRQESFFGPQEVERASAGTGFIIEDNVIVTNRHVIPRNVSEVSITLSDGTVLTGVEVLGRTQPSDPLDVAFLKVKDTKGKKLQPVKLGDSTKMEVGDKVVAIGNALGQFQNTVTTGIISGYSRSVEALGENGTESLQNLFQTDAAINQGNSGGPLVNMSGEVIGINTAVAADSENIGFAIPINDVKGLIDTVAETGKLERPYLGVRFVSVNDDFAYEYNLPVKRGAYIAPSQNGSSIIKGSPAEKAGLKEKDIIIKVNDTVIDEANSLTSVLGRSRVGDTVTLTISRDGQEQTVEVKLEAVPEE